MSGQSITAQLLWCPRALFQVRFFELACVIGTCQRSLTHGAVTFGPAAMRRFATAEETLLTPEFGSTCTDTNALTKRGQLGPRASQSSRTAGLVHPTVHLRDRPARTGLPVNPATPSQ